MFKCLLTLLITSCFAAAWAADNTMVSLDKQDAEFVRKAAQCGMLEVESSEIALKRGLTGPDKDFAEQMVSDHRKANKELQALAEKKGCTWPSNLEEKYQDKLDKINKASDKDFAERYLEKQISWHKDAVDLFEDEADKGKDADLKAFAIATLPTLKNHLEHAKKLENMH
jgi:putative membrane protein